MASWLPVVGYEGLYEVSSGGQVRSLPRVDRFGRTVKGGLMAARPNIVSGYLTVRLWREGRERALIVHRLVTEAFLGPRPDGQETRHLDGNPVNNRLSNLAYGTHSENVQDQLRHGTHHFAGKTHCPQGHPLSGTNLYVNPRGGRMCRTCARLSSVRSKDRFAITQ